LELNLLVLRGRVQLDQSIPPGVKARILEQIDTRTFETHLYISPSSNIPEGRLNVFPDVLGRPLDAVYILPETPAARD
jgi:hypothetical protein